MKTSILPLALVLLSALGCRTSGESRAGERIEYQERVTLTSESPVDYRAILVHNLGPGAITAEVELHDGVQYSDTILDGAEVSYILTWVKRVTLVHSDPAPATLEWSAAEAMRGKIEVQVD